MTDLLRRDDPVDGAPDRSDPPTGAGRGRYGAPRRRWWSGLRNPESVVTGLVVAACVLYVFSKLNWPEGGGGLLLRDTTPAGGDMGAHVWLPAYIKRVLLPHFQLLGWSMDWYAGFPALSFFFPLPMVAIAVFSYVIPYDVAFKLVSASGLIALPLACWAFGRLSRMSFPGPACLAVASVPFLFGREFTIYGGNIASTMAGEFGFSISLALAMIFLGLHDRALRTGRGRGLAAVLLACCGLSHILPLVFAIVGAVVLLALGPSRTRTKVTVGVLVLGGALMAFWALPFEYRLPYETNMGYQRITTFVHTLFPSGDLWLFLLAGVGGALALVRRNRVGTFLLLMAGLSALAFVAAPNGRLWNARWLPFWFLCLYLLAGVAFAEFGTMLAEGVAWRRLLAAGRDLRPTALIPIPIIALLVGYVWVAYPLRALPFGHVTASGQYDWLGITSSDDSYVPGWVDWNYSGYQDAGKPGRATYFALIDEMKAIGRRYGCGRAMYEYEPSINDFGTPDALMLLPYWTGGCIASMEGLYYESSATTPYHFLNVSECSQTPSDPMTGLAYAAAPDVPECVQHLQMFGVRYFMAVSKPVIQQADADADLRLLAKVGPYPTQVTNASKQTVTEPQTWNIYEVLDSPLVEPLANQPVVMKDVSGTKWLGRLTGTDGLPSTQYSPAESWYLDPSRWDVYETSAGPRSWARVPALDSTPPVAPEPADTVSGIHQTEESISFDVSRPGVPVLVKVSYFPNWQVHGARAVYRATPNLMIVVPTSTHVSLTYGYTPIDWIGFVISLLGLAWLAYLWRRPVLALARHRRPAHGGGRRPTVDQDPFWAGPDHPVGGDAWYGDEVPVSTPGLRLPPAEEEPEDGGAGVDQAPDEGGTGDRWSERQGEAESTGRPRYEIPAAPPPEDDSDAPWRR